MVGIQNLLTCLLAVTAFCRPAPGQCRAFVGSWCRWWGAGGLRKFPALVHLQNPQYVNPLMCIVLPLFKIKFAIYEPTSTQSIWVNVMMASLIGQVPKERTEPLDSGNSGDLPPSSNEAAWSRAKFAKCKCDLKFRWSDFWFLLPWNVWSWGSEVEPAACKLPSDFFNESAA